MTSLCGNCDCFDRSQCKNKGNSYDVVVETENTLFEDIFMDVPAAENDGKCKCGTTCPCINCTCGC